jgi:hypothetical protein
MRRALIVGAEADGLVGVLNDVAMMTSLLKSRQFAVEIRTGPDATRAGILDSFDKLIADSHDGDAIVVYFSGHGGLARVIAPDGNPLPELQFIVPTDYGASRPGDFRGITAIELSVRLARLTNVSRNVSVILDCCHAAHMVRNDGLRVRALPHPTYLDIGEHLGMLRALGLPTDLAHPISNPDAVRLVACAPWESSYEGTNNRGLEVGLLTDSLRVALDEVGPARVSWATLVQRIRDRVSTLEPLQRPAVEGPNRRILFELADDRGGTRFTVVRALADPNQVRLAGAALLGVRPGDTFGLTAAGVTRADPMTTVARATVSHRDGPDAMATFELTAGEPDLPAVTEAHPLVTSQRGDKVRLLGEGPVAEPMRSAVAAEPTLRAVVDDDPPDDDPVLAEVRIGDGLALWDGGSVPLRSAPGDAAGAQQVLDDLLRLARVARLRRLTPDSAEELPDSFTVEWGRIVDDLVEPLPPSGALLHVGEPIYLKLCNTSDRDLYFFVFDLGVAGAISLVTAADPDGLRIEPGQEHVVGERDNILRGSELVWPDGVPTDDPRPEALLVIVTAQRQDLSVLTQDGLEAGARESSFDAEPNQRYAVRRLEYQLSAIPTPARETPRFLVDERPDISLRLLSPRAATMAPSTVAVRLNDLVVHRNKALGGADVRVDTLVMTGGLGSLPTHEARTLRFSNVRDGQRLPMDNLVVYHGPAVDYLDIAWWVSRDRSESLALSDLLRQRLVTEDFHTAFTSIAVLAVAAPQAALAAAAVSGCAVLVSTAYELLSRVVGNSIGLYRTSLLASEDFGVGRHPIEGTQPAQDFSFAYEVLAID